MEIGIKSEKQKRYEHNRLVFLWFNQGLGVAMGRFPEYLESWNKVSKHINGLIEEERERLENQN